MLSIQVTGCLQVCELREARIDEETQAMGLSKVVEALKKDREALSKKHKVLDQAFKACTPNCLCSCQRCAAVDTKVAVKIRSYLLLYLHIPQWKASVRPAPVILFQGFHVVS